MGASRRAICESLWRGIHSCREKNLVFPLSPSIHPSPSSPRPVSPCSLMHAGDSTSRQAFIHKNLMKLDRKVHKNLIRSSLPDIWYKSNLGALQRIGVISSTEQRVFEGKKGRDFKTCASRVSNVRVRWHRGKWWVGLREKKAEHFSTKCANIADDLYNWLITVWFFWSNSSKITQEWTKLMSETVRENKFKAYQTLQWIIQNLT